MSSDSKNISDFADEVREPWRPSDERNLPYIALEHIEQGTLSLNSIGDLQEVASQGWRFRPSDVLFGKMRPYFRKVVSPRLKGVCSGEIAVVRAKNDDDINFLFYALANPKFIEFATVNSKGDRPRTKWEHFSKFPVKDFSAYQRKVIGDTLRNYDDLIENNRRRIPLLEDAARQLYQEWFVRLRFPGYENIKIVDGVPEGWARVAVPFAIDINPRTILNDADEHWHVEMSDLSINSMVIQNPAMKEGRSGSKFQNGDTLFARITPCLENGKTGFVNFMQDGETGFGSTEFIVLRTRLLTPEFVYCLARTYDFRENAIKSMVGSSGRQRVQEECFDKHMVWIPKAGILSQFRDFAEPAFKQIANLHAQNKKLAKARDLLLPRLMSGEITV